MTLFLKRLLTRWLVWVYVWEARKSRRDPVQYRRLVKRELTGIDENIEAYRSWLASEQTVLEARLNRRFDLGLALNESANRVIEAKKLAREANPDNLTDKQKMALEVQRAYLKRVAGNS